MALIYLAGGCFWGLEHYFSEVNGVTSTQVGYANGRTDNPTYEEVCAGKTGFAETVRLEYDADILPLTFLLELYFQAINPTTLNRQGADEGEQYRTGIYYVDEDDYKTILASLDGLKLSYSEPIVVEALPLQNFYAAEEYHQKYLHNRPGGYCHISPNKIRQAKQALVNPVLYNAPSDDDLFNRLPRLTYEVVRNSATEPPYSHPFESKTSKGIYVDIVTGEPLFSSSSKFDSGCGWPSFSKPIDPFVITENQDVSHGMLRTEVKSRVGRSHLGHVFEDGPKNAGGLRYCINGAALKFIPLSEMGNEGYGYLVHLVE